MPTSERNVTTVGVTASKHSVAYDSLAATLPSENGNYFVWNVFVAT